jgi:hypothetical protein
VTPCANGAAHPSNRPFRAGRPAKSAVLVFAQYGIPCGVCGHPAHHIEVYPNGVRTEHLDLRKRPCNSVVSATSSQPDRRRSEPVPPLVHPRAPASVRLPIMSSSGGGHAA